MGDLLLVCGSRMPEKFAPKYHETVSRELFREDLILSAATGEHLEIIEGCCKRSADEFAEDWANGTASLIHHCPGSPGRNLERNRSMVDSCSRVLAFWDGFSYGTAYTIAYAAMKGKQVRVVRLDD